MADKLKAEHQKERAHSEVTAMKINRTSNRMTLDSRKKKIQLAQLGKDTFLLDRAKSIKENIKLLYDPIQGIVKAAELKGDEGYPDKHVYTFNGEKLAIWDFLNEVSDFIDEQLEQRTLTKSVLIEVYTLLFRMILTLYELAPTYWPKKFDEARCKEKNLILEETALDIVFISEMNELIPKTEYQIRKTETEFFLQAYASDT